MNSLPKKNAIVQKYDFDLDFDHIDDQAPQFSFKELNGQSQENLFEADRTYADKGLLIEILHIAQSVPLAKHLVQYACAYDYKIETVFLESSDYHLDTEYKILSLNNFGLDLETLSQSQHYMDKFLASFLRGLRDIWHDIHIGSIYDILKPDEIIKIDRIRAADVETIACYMAWLLRHEGHDSLWRHILSEEDGDIAMIFQKNIEKGVGSETLRAALLHSFKQWFEDQARADDCDHETLNMMDFMLSEKGAGKAFGRRPLNAEQLSGLMRLPDGGRYLDGLKDDLLSNPLYAGLNNEVNQMHLYHIMQDHSGVVTNGIAFQSEGLAARIFPDREKLL